MEKNVLNTDLSGKVAVVTGASGTLCSIFAKALARAGAKVALLGRNMEKLNMDAMSNAARKALDSVGMSIDEYTRVEGMPVGYMQFVEIAVQQYVNYVGLYKALGGGW